MPLLNLLPFLLTVSCALPPAAVIRLLLCRGGIRGVDGAVAALHVPVGGSARRGQEEAS